MYIIQSLLFQALCCLGQTLRAYSTFISPDPPTQWLVHEMVSMTHFYKSY